MTEPSTLPLTEYWDKLNRADWTYEMSDDHRVWREGSAAMGALQQLAKQSPQHQELFDGFYAYVWNSKPKPERPTETNKDAVG